MVEMALLRPGCPPDGVCDGGDASGTDAPLSQEELSSLSCGMCPLDEGSPGTRKRLEE